MNEGFFFQFCSNISHVLLVTTQQITIMAKSFYSLIHGSDWPLFCVKLCIMGMVIEKYISSFNTPEMKANKNICFVNMKNFITIISINLYAKASFVLAFKFLSIPD